MLFHKKLVPSDFFNMIDFIFTEYVQLPILFILFYFLSTKMYFWPCTYHAPAYINNT